MNHLFSEQKNLTPRRPIHVRRTKSQNRDRRSKKVRLAFLAVALTAGALTWVWLAEPPAPDQPLPAGAPPLLEAGIFKIAPQDPGGLVIPHQDKTVYERLRRDKTEASPDTAANLQHAEEPLLNLNE